MGARSVLVVDDDAALRFALGKALRRLGYDVREAASGEAALVILKSEPAPDVAILDLAMEGIHGLEVLRRRGAAATRMIVLTGHGTVQAAVEAMQLGAFSFLEKPVDAEVLEPLLEQAIAEGGARRAGAGDFAPDLVGESGALREVRSFIDRVGPTEETVAIYGETGTGKEVVARHLHLASARRTGPFVGLNAACIPRELFESEIFGHKKGSFTGATADRPGLFREAHGGTLFIDELAEFPTESQAKLLRALETRVIRPVGESRELPVDVRIIAATNRDLWAEVQAGRFREDLYFRLQVFPVVLAPLRDRREDIAPLAAHLLTRVSARATLTDDAIAALRAYDWPGNVRELLNVLRRATLFADGRPIDDGLVRRMIAASVFAHAPAGTDRPRPPAAVAPRSRSVGAAVDRDRPSSAPSAPLRTSSSSLADVERAHIEQVLEEMGGNVTRAATALGIDRRTLQRKLRAFGIAGDDS